MKINEELVERISKLALLEFKSEEERLRIMADLERILNFMNKLNNLETSDVDPLVYMSDRIHFTGKDEIDNILENEDIFRNAPHHDNQYFKVPKVINKKSKE